MATSLTAQSILWHKKCPKIQLDFAMKIMESLAWNNYVQIFASKGRNGGMVHVAVNFSYR